MIKKALKYALIPVLFCVAVSLILCDLQASKEAQMREYEEAYSSVPVTVSATWPTKYYKYRANGQEFDVPNVSTVEINGRIIKVPYMITIDGFEIDASRSSNSPSVPVWVVDLFTGEEPVKFYDVPYEEDSEKLEKIKSEVTPTELSLAEYVKDVRYTLLYRINIINSEKRNGVNSYYLFGINSLSCDPQLAPENGCEIKWYEGYDESIFEGEEPYCLIPEGKVDYYDSGNGEVVLGFELRYPSYTIKNGELVVDKVDIVEHHFTFKIVGTYTGGDWKSVYCSVPAVEKVHNDMDVEYWYDSLSVTLADNSRLDEFREKASFYFPEQADGAEEVPWGYYANDEYHKNYPISLRIDDRELLELTASYEEKMELHRRTTMIAIAISAVVGLAIISLTVRSIKRDIDEQRFIRTIKEDE